MPTTYTVATLATDALLRLGAIDERESASAQEQARVVTLYDLKIAELEIDDRVYWTSASIPPLVFGALSRIIAEELAPSLGMAVPSESDDTSNEKVSIGTKGQRMLARALARPKSGQRVMAEYF